MRQWFFSHSHATVCLSTPQDNEQAVACVKDDSTSENKAECWKVAPFLSKAGTAENLRSCQAHTDCYQGGDDGVDGQNNDNNR